MVFSLARKDSNSASLFVAEKPNLKDFSRVILSGKIITIPIPKPFWVVALSTNNYQDS